MQRYQSRLSGPLLDRIDMHVQVDPLDGETLYDRPRAEDSATVRVRVESARRIQGARFEERRWRCNAELSGAAVREAASASPSAQRMLRDAVDRLGLSGRAHDRVLKVARTIADLDGGGPVDIGHVAEALAFRSPLVQPC